MIRTDYLLIAGTAGAAVAPLVAAELGVALTPCRVERFPDGEVSVEIGESVRRREVVIIQATSPPVNDHLVELMLLADACRRAAASHITAIVPYFGYARSDRRRGLRAPVSARAAATVLEASGIGHVVTVDVHAPQIEGFFSIPTDDIEAMPLLDAGITPLLDPKTVVVAPDLGAVRRARDTSRRLQRPMALCLKHRRSGTEVEVTGVVGDVDGRSCIIVDDMISTGATVAESARALRAAGASEVLGVAATHAVFAPGAAERLAGAGVREVVVTDTVAPAATSWPASPVLHVVSVAPLLARVIRRLEAGDSLRALG
jgi:ribose-phosphate pyrophosphokinase